MTWIKSLISFLFPAYCISCHERLPKEHHHICEKCFEQLPKYEGLETFYHPHDRIEGFVPFSEVRSDLIFTKHSVTRELIHLMKYQGFPELGYKLARDFALRHKGLGHFADISAIIPIPVAPRRLKTRGYNQSSFIAKGFGEIYKCPVIEDVLWRTSGNTQTKRDKEARWKAMDGVFEGQEGALAGKRILLIDDVLTSGATVIHASKALYDICGAESVSIYTLALDVYL
ncbi:ComF family protein [Porphyromonas cangingivalis]|uniref:ComF family protein n=1 Tax=Porphyromonas cangingivalis TaxID=36874 RepID=UPI00242D92F9|nr:phosphoribosyltransferase family protein [Porphyromonas cangingivalis]